MKKNMNRNVIIALLVAGLVVTLVGCDHETDRLLERAEAYLPAEPDSAEMCLNGIEEPARLGDEPRALYGLLRTYTHNRQGKEVKSDSLIRDSYEYYREVSHDGETNDGVLMRHYAQSCYYMALYYSSCDSTKQCEDMLHQAIKCSEKCEDWHTCYLAYTQLGINTCWSNTEYAIQQSLKALETYHKINDDVNNEVLILGHLAAKYLPVAQPDSALKYYMKGYKLAEKNHLVKSQNQMCMGIADTYCYMEENDKALNYAKRGITTADSTVLVSSLLSLAHCYYECDSLDQAKDILNTIPCDSDDFLSQYLVLRELSEIAIQQKDLDLLYVYSDSAYECLENRFFHAQSVKDEYYQANLAKELEKEKLLHEQEMSHWIWGTIILLILLIAAFTIYNVWKNKQRLVAEHQREMQHQKELLHQRSMKIAVLQKHLMEKLEYSYQLFSDSDEAQVTDEVWAETERLLNDTDGNFVQRLRRQHKEFREEDIQLCMLVRMKMPNHVVSKIYHIGVDAVKKRKLSLKKNGFKVTDPTIPLEDVIDQL